MTKQSVWTEPEQVMDRKRKRHSRKDKIDMGQRLVADGRIKLKPLITHHPELDDLEKGLMLCRDHQDNALKVIIDIH